MGLKSKRKGKLGERDAAKYLTSLGFTSRRGVQYSGSPDSPDVLCELLPNVHLEVKRDEAFDIGTELLVKACVQATNDAGIKNWGVLWRRSRRPWALTYLSFEVGGIVTACDDVSVRGALCKLNQEVR